MQLVQEAALLSTVYPILKLSPQKQTYINYARETQLVPTHPIPITI